MEKPDKLTNKLTNQVICKLGESITKLVLIILVVKYYKYTLNAKIPLAFCLSRIVGSILTKGGVIQRTPGTTTALCVRWQYALVLPGDVLCFIISQSVCKGKPGAEAPGGGDYMLRRWRLTKYCWPFPVTLGVLEIVVCPSAWQTVVSLITNSPCSMLRWVGMLWSAPLRLIK